LRKPFLLIRYVKLPLPDTTNHKRKPQARILPIDAGKRMCRDIP
jgi:hypothetical protein